MIVSMVNFKKQTSMSFMTFCSRFRSHKSARAIERYIFCHRGFPVVSIVVWSKTGIFKYCKAPIKNREKNRINC